MKRFGSSFASFIGVSGIFSLIAIFGGLMLVISIHPTTMFGDLVRILGYVITSCALILLIESIRAVRKKRNQEG